MNLILLFESDFIADDVVTLSDRRFEHIRSVHRAEQGDELTVGLLNGKMGKASVTELNESSVTLAVSLTETAPTPLPSTLILALPRPKVLRRVIRTVSELGIKQLYLINSYRVEKSYWQTPALTEESVREHLLLGLEQSKDTALPEVHIRKRFKPFVEDELTEIIGETTAFVAHPKGATSCPQPFNQASTVVIGPEGGFIPYEIEKLEEAGCQCITLGNRILKVETAIPTLIGKLYSDF